MHPPPLGPHRHHSPRLHSPRWPRLPPLTLPALASAVVCSIVAVDCARHEGASSLTARAAPAPPVQPHPAPPAANAGVLSPGQRTPDEQNTISVFKAAAPSTVFVTQKRVVVDFFRGRALEVPAGSGSGFVWDAEGHVVTNYHVIKGAESLSVTLQDQRSFDAKVVGAEPRKDIAVLKIEAPSQALHPIRVPKKAVLPEVGQKTIAIGNPFGLDHTLTTGVVSALGREVQGIGGVSIRDMIQTDAAINPGNSGGPLLDSAGQLMGMNAMIFSQSGASAGIGFAVPVSSIARVVPQIIKTGRAEQVGLGIRIDPAQRLERHADIEGIVVLEVVPNSPAARAGLVGIEDTPRGIKLGDVVVSIDGQRIRDYDDLYNTLDRYAAGQTVSVTLLRDGKQRTLELDLVLVD